MDGAGIRRLVDGAAYLLCNEYEAAVLEQKTGWSSDDVLKRVRTRVTTLGKRGARIDTLDEEPIFVPVARDVTPVDPTGVGDAFRAGFFCGIAWGLSHERAAQVGSMLAAHTIETIGTQEYVLHRDPFLRRFAKSYGNDAAAEVAPRVAALRD
jgi:adenosine kinase